MDSKRRRLVGALGSAFPLSGLNGCSIFRPDPAELCARPNAEGTDLLIDIHAHVFNGSDIQVKDFISHLDSYLDGVWEEALKEIGGLLQNLTWERAPSGCEELASMSRVQCGGLSDLGRRGARERAYVRALRLIDEAADRTLRLQALGNRGPTAVLSVDAHRVIKELRTIPYAEYMAGRTERALRSQSEALPSAAARPAMLHKTVATLLDFVIQHLQYRFANVLDYFNHYESGNQPPVDLLVTSFLDFDYWISQGQPTATSLPDQIAVMERISVLTGGRVHSFLPYCPLRDLITRKQGEEHGQSLRWIKEAITERGFIGVKIYPPMGFAPYGNEEAERDNAKLWHKDWIPERAKKKGFGKELDNTLAVFYDWCVKNSVPVMAHTSRTNIMHKDFELLPGSHYWGLALKAFRELRINLGHIGGNKDNEGAWKADGFIKLMNPAPMAYADIGYFYDVIDYQETLISSMRKVFAEKITRERMMYGSDYQMIISERGWAKYQREFRDVIRAVAPKEQTLEKNFFGHNAARYLGLTRSVGGRENNRSRLETFYKTNNIPEPSWMTKVDAIAAHTQR